VVAPESDGSRFDKTHNSYARASAVPAFICFDVALVTNITHRASFLNIYFYFKLANNNHFGIFGG